MITITVTPERPESEHAATADRRENQERELLVCVSFDIETGPLPEEQLAKLMPEFIPPPEPGEFDESSVKLGNLKDPVKIREKIDAARNAHEASVRNYAADVERLKQEHAEKFRSGAALDAITGHVVAIGVCRVLENGETESEILGQCDKMNERKVLLAFWAIVSKCLIRSDPMVGHNIHGFDLPFLVQRSWILGVPIPDGLLTGTGRKFWNPLFIDTMREWGFGNPQARVKLDTLAKAFDLEGKADGECCGANFHEFWFSDDAAKHDQAIEYLKRDIDLPGQIAMAMGVI